MTKRVIDLIQVYGLTADSCAGVRPLPGISVVRCHGHCSSHKHTYLTASEMRASTAWSANVLQGSDKRSMSSDARLTKSRDRAA